MLPKQYQELAQRTECDQWASRRRMQATLATLGLPEDLIPVRLNHSVIGMAGEVGELAGLVEKVIYYGREMPDLKDKFKDELGDLLWYVAQACNVLGLDMGEVMAANLRKLRTRYPDQYRDVPERDRVAEEQAVKDVPPVGTVKDVRPVNEANKMVAPGVTARQVMWDELRKADVSTTPPLHDTVCPQCKGSGQVSEYLESGPKVCGICHGQGSIRTRAWTDVPDTGDDVRDLLVAQEMAGREADFKRRAGMPSCTCCILDYNFDCPTVKLNKDCPYHFHGPMGRRGTTVSDPDCGPGKWDDQNTPPGDRSGS